jgi:hypothetical protein
LTESEPRVLEAIFAIFALLGVVVGFYMSLAIGVLIAGNVRVGREEVDLDWRGR